MLNLLRNDNRTSKHDKKLYQPLNLTVNGFAKRFMGNNFNNWYVDQVSAQFMGNNCSNWYTDQVSAQFHNGVPVDEIDVKLHLSHLKPLNVEWVRDFYNHMTSEATKKVIGSG